MAAIYLAVAAVSAAAAAMLFWIALPGPDGQVRPFLAGEFAQWLYTFVILILVVAAVGTLVAAAVATSPQGSG
jgi:hypothetical protein